MKTRDLIEMAIRNLSTRKLRTFLTILGVIIGTTSIIVMLSLGLGMQNASESQIKSMGDLTVIEVRPGHGLGSTQKKLTSTTLRDLRQLPNVVAISPIIRTTGTLTSGRYKSEYVSITGMDVEAMETFDYKIDKGRFMRSRDEGVIYGTDVARTFSDPKRPGIFPGDEDKPYVNVLKNKISISFSGDFNPTNRNTDTKPATTFPLRTIGLLKKKQGWEDNNTLFIPIDYLIKLQKASQSSSQTSNELKKIGKEFNSIKVKANHIDNVATIQKTIKELGYEASSLTDWLKEIQKNMLVFQAIFGGIGAISLIVASIGITNTMIMSIYERTREIGVMKVIGASVKDIERLFLVEAGFIGLLGGTIGIIFSFIFSLILNILTQGMMQGNASSTEDVVAKISIIPIWLIISALFFSTLIGILSGFLPAKRAVKLSALDAIRSE